MSVARSPIKLLLDVLVCTETLLGPFGEVFNSLVKLGMIINLDDNV